jgi:hypothetical protein
MGIVRIELHFERRYDKLHEEMETRGFTQTIQSSSGKRYQLPRGTYWKSEPTVASAMKDEARSAVRAAGAHPPAMIIATAGSSSFVGLPTDDDSSD